MKHSKVKVKTKDQKTKVKTMQLRSTINFQIQEKDMEHPKGKSLTVPNDVMSIEEILERSQNGYLPPIQRAGILGTEESEFDDDDLEMMGRLELSEQKEIAERMEMLRKESEMRLKEHQETQRRKKEVEEEQIMLKKWEEREAKKALNTLKKGENEEK